MNPGNCVSKKTLLWEHAVDFVFSSDDEVFTVHSVASRDGPKLGERRTSADVRHSFAEPVQTFKQMS